MKPATFDSPVSVPARSSRRVRPTSGRDALDVYLDRAGRHPRLTAEQERAELCALTELRRQRWEVLLSCPAAVGSILEEIERGLAEPPLPLIERLRDASDADRSDATRELAIALETLDVDGQLAGRLARELPTEGVAADDLVAYDRRVREVMARYCRARNRFICSNLRLVLKVTDRYSRRWMPLSDLVQEGNLGLIKAVERFDPDRGTRFSTYAVWWIRHAITRALVNRGRTVRVPAHLHVLFTKIRRAQVTLRGQLGRPPTPAELAVELDVPADKIRAASEAMALRSVSLDGPPEEEDAPSWSDSLGTPAPQSLIDDAFDQRRREAIALQAMEHLPARQRDILERRFALAGQTRMTLEAVGRCYDVSRERVRQLQKRALGSLRQEVETSSVNSLAFA